MELSFVRFQETRRSRAQVLKAKPRKTYLFTGTASKFNNFKAWKMIEVGNKPKFRVW